MLVAHEDQQAANASAQALLGLGWRARRLLEECVEHQVVDRTAVSRAAEQLEDAGFLFVRETGCVFQAGVRLQPSLLGEEALEALEAMQADSVKSKKS